MYFFTKQLDAYDQPNKVHILSKFIPNWLFSCQDIYSFIMRLFDPTISCQIGLKEIKFDQIYEENILKV